MRFSPRSDSLHCGSPPFGVQDAVYTVVALLPTGNPNVRGADDNDQVTLSGAVDPTNWPNATATVSTAWFENTYRIS